MANGTPGISPAMTPAEKFQSLLRELFQFDCADLDFGIYRIMNYKRQVIENWITEDLPRAISEELKRGALNEQAQAQDALKDARQKVLEALGEEALNAAGNLAEKYRETPAGRAYLEALEKTKSARSTEALEAAIYNHLFTFFSRYWEEGDFISKRRYSKKERYAIPYNGEEVYLYWANHDQYYVKTGEYFTDYSYKAPNGVSVHFKLRQADVEQNNIKGEKRFFLPALDGLAWDEKARTLTIPFEFRPLKQNEENIYSKNSENSEGEEKKKNKNQQEAIIVKAAIEIPKRVQAAEALAALTAERRKNEEGETVTWLEHHLRQYTRRNTSDFFIHKDLRGFLSRELDFYLKNEVLNLEEMEAAGEQAAEGWFQLMRLIKRVGGHIIDFLAQIEDFQKMLWEKKKFVTETFYVITLGKIPAKFYTEIADCNAQWEEWKALGFLNVHGDGESPSPLRGKGWGEGHPSNGDERIAFLKAHPTLPLDTRHFSQEFTDRLLAAFDNLDEMTDGLLVHSENWQALNLLQEKYRERVKCIYIDPPYNTGGDEFVYRDNYQHSCWLSMMMDRLGEARGTIQEDGAIFVSIDDNEVHNLRHTMNLAYGTNNFEFIIEWQARKSVSSDALLSYSQNHILLYAKNKVLLDTQKAKWRLSIAEGREEEFSNPDGDLLGSWKLEPYDAPEIRPNLEYPIVNPATGKTHYPTRGRHWRYPKEVTDRLLEEGRIVFGKTGKGKPALKRYLSEIEGKGQAATTWWDDVETTTDGTKLLQVIMGGKTFNNPKPIGLITRMCELATEKTDTVLDFFAGSGTTGHAVIALNREDGGRRRFILVEMAHYFDTVLLPRLKKVIFTPEWQDGKPKRMATKEEAERSPRLVKVIRLESYEDALNNLTFDDASGQQALDLFKDDYLLHYMLRWETRHSATLLDVEKLQTPFSYKLRLHRDGETRERFVDLPETFNYLLGLDVQTRKVLPSPLGRGAGGEGRYLVYRGVLRKGRAVAVIWRETQGWTKDDYERDRDFVAEHKLADGADEIFVNGDSLIPGAQSLDPLFKERMFAGVEG